MQIRIIWIEALRDVEVCLGGLQSVFPRICLPQQDMPPDSPLVRNRHALY
jgi:hypothetical protein